jgi:hypothetical protein
VIEAPDKRVWFFFGPTVVVGLAFMFSPPGSTFDQITQTVLSVFLIALGAGLAALCIRDGFSLLHPSTTREGSSIMFWADVGGCVFAGAMGIWHLLRVTGSAV